MIIITPLASSSAGNAYRVSDGKSTLLLDAGIPYKELRQALGFRVSQLAGCLISHEHGDHGKAAKDLMKAGVDVWASEGTLQALNLTGHRARVVKAKQQFVVGTWTIMPFDVQHDVSEPLGFLLSNEVGDKLVFATDTYYIRYRFQGLTHVMIECNYSIEILNENIAAGRVPEVMKKRLLRSHFSLENVLEFLKANDMRTVQEIWLLHLSDNNSDEERFKRVVQETTGKQVYVARR